MTAKATVTALRLHLHSIAAHTGRVVPEFSLDHIRELIHAPFRVVYLKQAKEVVLIRVWRSERQLDLPESET
ncbi:MULTISPECIES: type II toxin-antitoxin system RelE/ParE family toxin [unclassified Marinobacter]|jgi:toxin ParE1/3/4|uniref:type II toxin-antitoxin system RelE/ParE family toxin n=1 Tax=unclassified Marinobacter TaxID=83889 RepID=UPI0030D99E97